MLHAELALLYDDQTWDTVWIEVPDGTDWDEMPGVAGRFQESAECPRKVVGVLPFGLHEGESEDVGELEGDECPNCHNGTLAAGEAGELACAGECGAILRKGAPDAEHAPCQACGGNLDPTGQFCLSCGTFAGEPAPPPSDKLICELRLTVCYSQVSADFDPREFLTRAAAHLAAEGMLTPDGGSTVVDTWESDVHVEEVES